MSDQGIPPLEDDLRYLVDDARPLDEGLSDAKGRVRGRLRVGIDAPRAEPAAREPSGRGAKVPVWGAGGLLLAGLVGGYVLRGTPPERVVYIDRPSPALISSAPPAAVPSARAASSVAVPPSASAIEPSASSAVSAPTATIAEPSRNGADLGRERGILDVARAALGRENAAAALDAARAHERAFPEGALREEREAIVVQALVLGGETAKAKTRADRFRERYPKSLLLPAVMAAVGASQ